MAEINHPNIVRYYNSWLEATTKSKKSLITLSRGLSEVRSTNSEGVEEDRNEDSDDEYMVVFEDAEQGKNGEIQFGFSSDEGKQKKFVTVLGFDGSPTHDDDEEEPDFEKNSPTLKKRERSFLKIGEDIVESLTLYIQTELCDMTLEDYIGKRNERLLKLKVQNSKDYKPEKQNAYKVALNYAKQILNALTEIHSHKVVHRDLKPGNIFLNGDVAKIGDFGLVKRLNSVSIIEASPLQPTLKGEPEEVVDFILDAGTIERSITPTPELIFHRNQSDFPDKNEKEFVLEFETSITKSVGTKTFASPEQLRADIEKFDHRVIFFALVELLGRYIFPRNHLLITILSHGNSNGANPYY